MPTSRHRAGRVRESTSFSRSRNPRLFPRPAAAPRGGAGGGATRFQGPRTPKLVSRDPAPDPLVPPAPEHPRFSAQAPRIGRDGVDQAPPAPLRPLVEQWVGPDVG